MSRFAVAAGVCLVVLSCAVTGVRAQAETSVELDVKAPEDAGCPSRTQLQEAVEARVGTLVFTPGTPTLSIQVSFAQTGSGPWIATVRLRATGARPSGERALSAQTTDCQSLLEALTVVISTLVGIRDERTPTAEPLPLRAADEVVTRDHEQAPALHPGFALALLGRADLGLLPGLAGAAVLMGELALGDWSMSLAAQAWPGVTQDLGALARARLRAGAGRMQLCWRALGTIALCGGAEAGALELRSSGLADAATRVEPFLRAHLGLRAQLALTRQLGLRLELEANAPLLRTRFYLIEGDGQRRDSHTLTPGIGAGLGVYWRFFS